jgi:hypothetical protein
MRRGIVGLALLCALLSVAATANAYTLPPIKHVFVLIDENESDATTFGAGSPAPYLAKTLTAEGAYVPNYYGVGHNSLDNYIAMVSGQAPNTSTSADCPTFAGFTGGDGLNASGQETGEGCVYPTGVPTLMSQLDSAGLTWRAYEDSMGADPTREAATCGHPAVGAVDNTEGATATDQYATRHDPFVYFHSVIDNTSECNANVVNLTQLPTDLQSTATTPNYVFITPDLCNDGHDSGNECTPQGGGGLKQADTFLQTWVPQITASPAFKHDGLLIITFDEASTSGPAADFSACCGETPGPGEAMPGVKGPGGGDVGAVLLSPYIAAGTATSTDYNHYSMLGTVEDLFGLGRIGEAVGVTPFGHDIFTNWNGAGTGDDPTSTTVACAPASVMTGSPTTCTATVGDTASSGASTPTGTVAFTSAPTTGSFGSSGSCTLAATGTPDTASCQVTFTPSVASSYTMTGGYPGDGAHGASSGRSPAITSISPTSTSVACTPASVVTGSSTTCTATVTDTATSGVSTPAGTVAFTSTPTTGSFGGSGSCTLAPAGTTGAATCQIQFTPSAAGDFTISGSYGAESTHESSGGSGLLAATSPTQLIVPPLHLTSATVACTPASVVTGSPTTCTTTVRDTAASGVSTPSGTVSFTSAPSTGSFGSAGRCALAGTGTTGSAACQVTFTPTAGGDYTISGGYGGDSTHQSSVGPGALTATAPAPARGALTISGRAKVSKSGVAAVKVSCSGASGAACAGTLTLTTTVKVKVKRRRKGHTKTVTEKKQIKLGSARYSLAAHGSKTIKISLSRAGVKLVRHATGHRLKAKAVAKATAGSSATRTVELSYA